MGAADGKKWIMLVAGSNTWDNYWDQANVCHAYQIVHQNGIPDDQIVVMMYDDIAHNRNNPCPGNIINKPNGPNVYPGVPKDYTGEVISFIKHNTDVFVLYAEVYSPGVRK
ncbi:Legumain [Labeo rohita]|uniref:Legumain n=1 Tax=Labeo rohita TaxID=84645 RepID=A0ABQ8LAH0_LABRO|nr:Legumain [Labeo rohita]